MQNDYTKNKQQAQEEITFFGRLYTIASPKDCILHFLSKYGKIYSSVTIMDFCVLSTEKQQRRDYMLRLENLRFTVDDGGQALSLIHI